MSKFDSTEKSPAIHWKLVGYNSENDLTQKYKKKLSQTQ